MQDWLAYRAGVTPEATALVRTRSGETLTFGSLDRMVDDLAGRLAALGVDTGDHLGMVMESRLAAVCTVYAATRLGAVLVPCSDRLTSGELSTQVEAADVTTLVCSAATEQTAVEADAEVPLCSVDDPKWDEVQALAEADPIPVETPSWTLDDTQLLMFTSGTTGSPKAVRLTAGNVFWSAVASAFRLGVEDDDRWLVTLSLHHMGGLTPVLRAPLYGMTVVLRESFDPGGAADDIESYDVTCVSLVPTMLRRMLDLRGTLADSLRLVLLGGAPAPEDLLCRCRDFSIPVHPTYGMTETASQIATATPKEAFSHLGTVGRPLFWTDLTVRTGDGTELPPGEVGEFVVDGPTVTPGYYGDTGPPESPFGPHGLRTGDVGYRDADGRTYVLDRVDDRIVTGGENVSPAEVADVLERFDGVHEAAVVGIPDDVWGERVAALVVPEDGDGTADAEGLTVGMLDEHCREHLAGFKIPRVFAFAEEVPRTDSGTVEREAVRDQLVTAGEPIPDAEDLAAADAGDAAVVEVDEHLFETAAGDAGDADPVDRAGEGAIRWRRPLADDGDDGSDTDAPDEPGPASESAADDAPEETADFTRMTPPSSQPGEPKMSVETPPDETPTDADSEEDGSDAEEMDDSDSARSAPDESVPDDAVSDRVDDDEAGHDANDTDEVGADESDDAHESVDTDDAREADDTDDAHEADDTDDAHEADDTDDGDGDEPAGSADGDRPTG